MKKLLTLSVMVILLLAFGKKSKHTETPQTLAQSQPNILLLIGDDIGFGDLGAYGSEIKTPNMDLMAERGVRFTNFRASPVCSVTRSMLLTGCNNIEVGLGAFDYSVYPPTRGKPGYESYLTKNAVAISELLNDAGYEVYKSGKWHLGGEEEIGGGTPLEWGFTKEFGILSGGSNHWNDLAMTPDFKDPNGLNVKRKEHWTLNGEHYDRPEGVYSGEIYTNQMIDFIRDGKSKNKPWFAYMAFTTAHFPIQAPPELVDKYYEDYLNLGFEGLKQQRYESLKKHGLISKSANEAPSNPLTHKWEELSEDERKIQARVMATYAAMIEDQDRRTGQIIDYLRESGQLDNTLIIYLTDNGPEGFEATHPKTGNPEMAKWIESQFDQSFEAIGTANSIHTIGVSWANAATGGLQWWKWFIGEGGVRVPMMIVPPGGFTEGYERAGEISSATASVKDIPMTIMDYAGIEHPKTEYKGRKIVAPSGVSIKPFLEKKSNQVRTEKDWYAFELFGNCYVVQGDYKAIKVRTGMFGDGEWHLYNIVEDPSETVPLERDQPERLENMKTLYNSYAEANNIMEVDSEWNPFKGASQ
ncbi:arylsulfatase [Flagellimonas hymeniacidonis]|uniref:Arylsulfatase n=1 Tax=Flagellimonas hymeniacidonis TaxID=2603628 RepID=A0A5C8V2K2_9FLAO|nr:arylsulfatase [Flagellimonas hymeniacidonis]TXN34978.1 arylsulfatase [Flagellimonas hymeniacidonis]